MTMDIPSHSVRAYLVDAGPIVSALNRLEQYHDWARRVMDTLDAPLLTCEAVLSEAWFVARRGGADPTSVMDMVRGLGIQIVPAWGPRTEAILRRYADRSSVADASLLALAEEAEGRVVVTTDRQDFSVYRLDRHRAVPILAPPA